MGYTKLVTFSGGCKKQPKQFCEGNIKPARTNFGNLYVFGRRLLKRIPFGGVGEGWQDVDGWCFWVWGAERWLGYNRGLQMNVSIPIALHVF